MRKELKINALNRGIGRKQWGIGDTYLFISRYCSSACHPSPSKYETSCFIPPKFTPLVHAHLHHLHAPFHQSSVSPSLYQYQSHRAFHDYFTATLPNTNQPSVSSVVRIPFITAKQHFGVTRSRGNRPQNEDWYQAGVLDVCAPGGGPGHDSSPNSNHGEKPPLSPSTVFYFAVFDGHGGDQCSVFLRDRLHEYIEEAGRAFHTLDPVAKSPKLSLFGSKSLLRDDGALAKEQRKRLQQALIREWNDTVDGYFKRFQPDFGGGTPGELGDGSPKSILTYAFLRADLDFITNKAARAGEETTAIAKTKPRTTSFKGGSTASVALIYSPTSSAPFWDPSAKSTLVTAHVGDTRILLSNTNTGLAVPITSIHHPSTPTESRRLRRYAAAFIQDSFGEERFGILANTRAFGDYGQKRLGVTAEPEVSRRELAGEEWAFMVLCSDGVTGVLSDQEIVDIVKEARTPEEGAKEMVRFAEEVGSSTRGQEDGVDNATAMVIRLGGWEDRSKGGEGSRGTKELREWRVNASGARRH